MAAIDILTSDAPAERGGRGFRFDSGWVIVGFALILLLVLGYRFMADPSLSAPTRDPAWYTWRSQVVMESDPGSVAGEWGPGGLFSGGYRVTTPLEGALLQRVAGIDSYSFSAFLMLGIPVLTGLAFGAGAYRSRKHGLVVLLTMLATAGLFLTTPYVGYLDNITILFLLALMFPFLGPARTSWGARSALFLIGIAAAFTHPTTCVLFGATMMAVFGFHFLTSRFRLGEALKRDAPALMAVGFGMIVGLASWMLGIWGTTAKISDAALPPPYTKKFFMERLTEWIGSMQPLITVPLILIAIVSTVLLSRRERKPADAYDVTAAWWLFPLLGIFTFFAGQDMQIAGAPDSPVVPYYRFMNATAAPMALAGLGAFVAVRWLWKGKGIRLLGGALAALVVVGSLGWLLVYGTRPSNWVSAETQWANQQVRTSLAAVHEVVAAAGERPNVLIMNYNDQNDETGTNTAYGWAKTYTNIFRTGLPGADAKYSVTYLGTIPSFLAGEQTTGASDGYNTATKKHFDEMQARFAAYPEPPVAFVIGQFYKGVCNGGACGDDTSIAPQLLQDTLTAANAVEVGPDVYVLTGDGLYTPDQTTVDAATAAAQVEAAKFADHPSAWENPLHTLRVLFGLFVLAILPGLLAMRFFEIDDSVVSKIALVPGISIVLTLLTGIAVLAVWRGPLTTTKGWVIAALAVGLGAVLGVAKERIFRPLESFGSFFNGMFATFSNRSFAVLLGMQFLAQAGQGVVQGAIAKSLAFGGEKGFDVQNLPSADYALKVVLLLYVPYMLISPFIGVFIDRFPRRRVAWWANVVTAVLVVLVALGVLAPLGSQTTEGKVFATYGLIFGLLVVQACVRVVLAVKSASIPDVVGGKDLLQGNGLSQAGGALFQVIGIVFGGLVAGLVAPMVAVLAGAAVLAVAGFVALQMTRVEARQHVASFGAEVSQILKNIVAGVKEVASRPPAALGLLSFQMLRYQFWGFALFSFALYAKNLAKGGNTDTLSLVISGVGGLFGGAFGLVLAQKVKDRIPPVRLLLGSMAALGIGTLIGGAFLSLPGFAAMLFIGFFTFFVGKISADTITQQSMPDDFRGRAFALFDIAYNLGYIVPALILSFIWVENDPTRTRLILLVSGAVFLGLTALVAGWAGRIRGQFAPQDNLIGEEAAELAGSPE